MKNAQLFKLRQIESMYTTLKDDFAKLMQVLEGKEAYVGVLEDKLREADYEQLLRGKQVDPISQMAKKGSKRKLVTSDTSFLEKVENYASDVSLGANIGNVSSNSHNVSLRVLGKSTPFTPPDQKIPPETSPQKLTSPFLSTQSHSFAASNPGDENIISSDVGTLSHPKDTQLMGPAGRLRPPASKMKLKRK